MQSKKSRNTKTVPFVSAIIPVFNDEKGIQETLESLSKQEYPKDRWEVIVVDNNSTDNTFQVAKSFEKIIPSLKVEQEVKQSSYAARNRGIGVARGEILAFIDSDMTVKQNWLSMGVADIQDQRAAYVGCRVDIYTTHIPPTICEIYDQRTGFPIEKHMKSGFGGAGNLFVKRKVFDKVGKFDPLLISSGDVELGHRVRDSGFKIYYSGHNAMKHPARAPLKPLLSQLFRHGRGHAQLTMYYPERYSKRNFLHLRSFIPGKPWKIIFSTDKNWDGLSIRIKTGFYLLNWILKVIRQIGYIYESIKGGQKRNNVKMSS